MNKEFPGHFQIYCCAKSGVRYAERKCSHNTRIGVQSGEDKKIMVFLESSNFLISIFKNFLGKDFSYVKLF